jgi:hypothetical protein
VGEISNLRVTCVENGCKRDEVSRKWGKLEVSHSQIIIFFFSFDVEFTKTEVCHIYAVVIWKIIMMEHGG